MAEPKEVAYGFKVPEAVWLEAASTSAVGALSGYSTAVRNAGTLVPDMPTLSLRQGESSRIFVLKKTSKSSVTWRVASSPEIKDAQFTSFSGDYGLDTAGRVWKLRASSQEAITPSQVLGLPVMRTISANEHGGYGLNLAGSVWGWGSGTKGRLGRKGLDGAQNPLRLDIDGVFKKIFAVEDTGYAVGFDKYLQAWGSNEDFKLGKKRPATWTHRPEVIHGVTSIEEVIRFQSGSNAELPKQHHVLARSSDGNVHAWGRTLTKLNSWWGREARFDPPMLLSGAPDAKRIFTTRRSVSCLTYSGDVFAWQNLFQPAIRVNTPKRLIEVSKDGSFAVDKDNMIWGNRRVKATEINFGAKPIARVANDASCSLIDGSSDIGLWLLIKRR